MKNKYLLLVTIGLMLASCDNVKTPTGDVDSESKDFLKSYQDSYNVSSVININEGDKSSKINQKVYLGNDYFTSLTYDDNLTLTETNFYEKDSDGGVINKKLSDKNKIIETPILGNDFASSTYSNYLSKLGVSLNKDGKELIKEEYKDNLNIFNNQLSNNLTSDGEFKDTYFEINSDVLTYHSEVNKNNITYTIDATFLSKDKEETKKLKILDETETSKKANNLFNKLKENNYTISLNSGDTLLSKIYVNKEDIYVDNQKDDDLGYYKIDSGYQVVKVKGETISNSETSTDKFTSLLADFDVSGEIFVGETEFNVSKYVKDSVINHFETIGLENLIYDDSSYLFTDDNLIIKSKTLSSNYEITFYDINSTTLPINIRNITSSKSWKDESSGNNTIQDEIETLIGKGANIPYFDTGSTWTCDVYSTYLDMYSGDVSEEDADKLVLAYCDKLVKAGFKKYSEDEMSQAESDGWFYPMVGVGSSDYLFDYNDSFYLEVYNCYETGYLSGVGLYIGSK